MKRNIIALSLIALASLPFLARASWGIPGFSPFAGNALSAPTVSGSNNEAKVGGLILNTGGAQYGLLVGGKVGIGILTPASVLSVVGGIQIGIDNAACSAAKAGTLRFSSNVLQVCDGLNWINADGTSPVGNGGTPPAYCQSAGACASAINGATCTTFSIPSSDHQATCNSSGTTSTCTGSAWTPTPYYNASCNVPVSEACNWVRNSSNTYYYCGTDNSYGTCGTVPSGGDPCGCSSGTKTFLQGQSSGNGDYSAAYGCRQ